jgi:c-di-GMP-binding flagellar brake protein YcgR
MYSRKWGQDRRRFQRLNLNLVVWYKLSKAPQVPAELGTAEREAVTVDISPFGMAFMSSFNIPIFTDLALKFIIFSSQGGVYDRLAIPLEVNAKVRSCSPAEKGEFRIGVSFTDIQLEQQQKLMKFARESLRPFV